MRLYTSASIRTLASCAGQRALTSRSTESSRLGWSTHSCAPVPDAVATTGRRAPSVEHAGSGAHGFKPVGGESGGGARPMHPDWVRGLRDQVHAAGAKLFVKQIGNNHALWPNVTGKGQDP